jgi:holo-[acyl-carrier protein] synthase
VPFRVGIDLVRTDEVGESVRLHGDRYLNRVFTDAEQDDAGADLSRLAAGFAAKEATMKALRRGGEEGLSWRSIELRRAGVGGPTLKLSGAAADLAKQKGVRALSVSLTQEGSLAAAVVLARYEI